MKPNNSFWEDERGSWKLASLLVRELCRSAREGFVSHGELYAILDALNATKRFSEYWDRPEFYQASGIPEIAASKVDRSRDGWLTQQGDLAWAAGDIEQAVEYYKQSVLDGDICLSGWGGLFRVAFSQADYSQCVSKRAQEIFKQYNVQPSSKDIEVND